MGRHDRLHLTEHLSSGSAESNGAKMDSNSRNICPIGGADLSRNTSPVRDLMGRCHHPFAITDSWAALYVKILLDAPPEPFTVI
jgi:hypothetical protein